jgi:hypothetical protein
MRELPAEDMLCAAGALSIVSPRRTWTAAGDLSATNAAGILACSNAPDFLSSQHGGPRADARRGGSRLRPFAASAWARLIGDSLHRVSLYSNSLQKRVLSRLQS